MLSAMDVWYLMDRNSIHFHREQLKSLFTLCGSAPIITEIINAFSGTISASMSWLCNLSRSRNQSIDQFGASFRPRKSSPLLYVISELWRKTMLLHYRLCSRKSKGCTSRSILINKMRTVGPGFGKWGNRGYLKVII